MDKAGNIKDFFMDYTDDLGGVTALARRIREKILDIDPFVQLHSSAICSACREVCCVSKHGCYVADDFIYLYALGLEPRASGKAEGDGLCRFLSARGCTIDRTARPSGCNWYFCNNLHASMEGADGAYADFDACLSELADLWLQMSSEFRMRYRTIMRREL